MGHIIVGVDGSEGAASALRWARREAGLRGWELTALLAWSYLDQPHDPEARSFDPAYGEEDARKVLDQAVEAALGAEAAQGVERQTTVNLPATALLTASEGADLLVVGARGLGGFKALLLGSVSEQCLNHARCPVAVVHPGHVDRGQGPGSSAGAPERIVVGVDGSPGAQRALEWALDEARARRATVTTLHTWRTPVAGVGPMPIPLDPDQLQDEAQGVLDTAVAEADTSELVAPVERVAQAGLAAQGLLEAARDADLVVLGTRGRGGFAGLLLGSVSHQVARHADCPVVVVPDPR